MRKKLIVFIGLLLCFSTVTFAQERKVTGIVKDNEGGLPGVTIQIKGTQKGVVTDVFGKYSITVPSSETVLVYQFVGYEIQEATVGNQSVMDILMVAQVEQLDEIVVTGQAIEREKRTLGYSITSVDGEELTKARSANFVNGLSGKVPGVQVSQASGNLGGSSRIVIRGVSSLSGDNQPLFVVDGIPIGNSNVATGSGLSGAFDAGNGANDLNANDIESYHILKGGAAAALYGSRAANGVILITTKKGSKSLHKPTVSINSSTRFETPLLLPSFQNSYAEGTEGKYSVGWNNGWGPLMEGQEVPLYNYEMDINSIPNSKWPTTTLVADPDNVEGFYETGYLLVNSADISQSFENGNDYRVGFTAQNQEGIVPYTSLDRYTFALNGGVKLLSNLKGRIGVNYVTSENQGGVAQGANSPNVLTSIMNGMARHVTLDRLKLNSDGSQNPIGRSSNSPYWIAAYNGNNVNIDRVYGYTQFDYEPKDWLSFTLRGGGDFRKDERLRKTVVGTLGRRSGGYSRDNIQHEEIITTFLAKAVKDITPDLKFTALLGQEYNQRRFKRQLDLVEGLRDGNDFSLSNAVSHAPFESYSEKRTIGFYGDISFTYKNYLTLNLTGRNDWSSTLPVDNRSYFYPSANIAFVFTDLMSESFTDILSYGKLRIGAAQVGSDTDPYRLQYYYLPQPTYFGQYGLNNYYPFNGQAGYTSASATPSSDLKPERQSTYEIGTELQFFDGRVGIDATYYNIRTTNQIIDLPVAVSSGFKYELMNVGEVANNGIELLFSLQPVKTDNVIWDMQLNYSKNNMEVVSLEQGVTQLQMESGFSGVSVKAEVGQALQLYGVGFKKAETGEILVDPKTGLRMVGESENLGQIAPDFMLGLQNSFTWKGLSLSFLLDWSQGGVMYSATVASLRSGGVAEETAYNREGMFIDTEAYVENEDGTLRPNDIPVTAQNFWTAYSSNSIAEGSVFDKTFVKLRELKLSYNIPSNFLQKFKIRRASIGIEGRNLAILYSKIPHIDPETSLFQSSSNAAGAVEMGSLPSTRSVGFNLQLTF